LVTVWAGMLGIIRIGTAIGADIRMDVLPVVDRPVHSHLLAALT
jgi:hypothetical protein